ncbi:MAG: hypothetical protein M1815_005838 [Lichina confinis]|nr:MAG: hypothetical protein M1815_005838 [Lichina confinis]
MDQFMLDWSAAAECIYTKLGLFELERQKYHVSGADMMWAARQCGLDIEFLDVQSVWEVEIKPGMEPMNVPRNNVKSSFMRALKIEEGGPAQQRAPGFFAGRKAGSFARPVVPLGIR